ncbi:Tail assembly protein [Gammaproteobacteria bacterium]
MVTITLHGEMGKALGKAKWILDVKKVSEAIHAINVLTENKLNKYLKKHGEDGFSVVVNNRTLTYGEKLDINDKEIERKIKESQLNLSFKNLQTIDIVPVVVLANSDILNIVLGVVLIIVGVLIAVGTLGGGAPLSAALIIGGIGIIAAGVINLLSKPPVFEDYREISKGGKTSYLFNGPENVINDGGPVPIGYGRLLVGSQVIAASYNISNIPVNTNIIPVTPAGLVSAFNFGGAALNYFKSAARTFPPADNQELQTSTITTRADTSNTFTIFRDANAIAESVGADDVYKTAIEYTNARNKGDGGGALNLVIYKGTAFINKPAYVYLRFSEFDSNVTANGQRVFSIWSQNSGRYIDGSGNFSVTPKNIDVYSFRSGKYRNFDIKTQISFDSKAQLYFSIISVGDRNNRLSCWPPRINAIEVYDKATVDNYQSVIDKSASTVSRGTSEYNYSNNNETI